MTDSSSQSLLPQSSTFIRTDWPQGGDRTPHPHLLYLSSALSLLTPPKPLNPPSSQHTKSSTLALGQLNSSTQEFRKPPGGWTHAHIFPYSRNSGVCLCAQQRRNTATGPALVSPCESLFNDFHYCKWRCRETMVQDG